MLSDRDFDENDYEALLALDDTVESRKGGTSSGCGSGPSRACAGLGAAVSDSVLKPAVLASLLALSSQLELVHTVLKH